MLSATSPMITNQYLSVGQSTQIDKQVIISIHSVLAVKMPVLSPLQHIVDSTM